MSSPSNVDAWLNSAASESRAWFLEWARRQAGRKRPADLLQQYARDSFVALGVLDLRLAHRLDGIALDAAAEYEALLLSPLAPLGCCSAIAPTSQDRTVSTTRGTEVVSDPTNVFALECARRLRSDRDAHIRLCTIHQTVRAQALPTRAGHTQHFRMFALVDAGRGRAEDGFEVEAIAAQLSVYDRLFDASAAALGCRFPGRKAILRARPDRRVLVERAAARLAECLPHVPAQIEDFESNYYDGVRVSFGAETSGGEFCPIGDLGVFDWLARLSADRRMRFVAGGFGLQLVPLLFRDS
jgi:hypothetical protein